MYFNSYFYLLNNIKNKNVKKYQIIINQSQHINKQIALTYV